MKFDFIIGNPPYQDESKGENDKFAPAIYDKFLDNAYKLGDCVEMIHPARFLVDAGSTSKEWNQKMRTDPHIKILEHNVDSSVYFPETDIKGGIVITLRNSKKEIGPIGDFVLYDELKEVPNKINAITKSKFSDIIYAPESYKFTEELYKFFPNVEKKLSKGHKYDLKSSVFDKLIDIIFFENLPSLNGYVKVVGLLDGKRTSLWIKEAFISPAINFNSFKFLALLLKSVGNFSGQFIFFRI